MKSSLALIAPLAILLSACASSPMPGGTAPAAAPSPVAAAAPDGPGRDWTRVDTNRDNLVSAAEMEAWLAANPGPLKGR